MTRDLLLTTARVAQRLLVTSDTLGKLARTRPRPSLDPGRGSIPLPAPERRGLLGRERIQGLAVCSISSAAGACRF
jgi:hypothetical protein